MNVFFFFFFFFVLNLDDLFKCNDDIIFGILFNWKINKILEWIIAFLS